MIDEPVDGQRHLDWLGEIGLHETAFFVSFYYIEIDAIGPDSHLDDEDNIYEDWIHGSDYESWNRGRLKQLREVRKLNRRHAHRYRRNKQ